MPEKKRMSLAEKWENLTFANNFIFCKVLEENPDITKEILELLLDIQIDHIEQPASQKEFKVDFDSRGIRFDVYVKDGDGRSFDIEIQTSHFLDLGKRARYYQGLTDVDNVQSGMDYDVLKDSYVIFLCLGDPFGQGLPVYTFRYRADENTSILMGDGTVNIFFNAKKYAKMKSEKMQAFCEYLCGQKADSDFTDRLSVLVERLKLNSQRRHEYMTWEQEIKRMERIAREEALEEGREEGLSQGRIETRIETAKNLLDMQLLPEQIAKATGLSLEQVVDLQKEICVTLC